MLWFSAHIVMRVLYKEDPQNHCPAIENICLISAHTDEDAQNKAEAIGRTLEGDSDGSFTWCERPAEWKFVGVRKLIEVRNSTSSNNSIDDGTEVTYSIYDFRNTDQLLKFMVGEEVFAKIIE